MQIIPFSEPSQWSEQITLSGNIYLLEFKWNSLNKYWSMNIFNRNAEPIVLGIKVVTNYNLTAQYVADGMPTGQIFCQNIIQEWIDIGRFDMGKTTELIYYEAAELA